MHGLRWLGLALGLCVLFGSHSPAFAEPVDLVSTLRSAGYVSLPVSRDPQGRMHVEAKIHGERMTLRLDFSNEGALFDVRRLRKLGLEFQPTEHKIPTPRKLVKVRSTEILGIEFEGRSTPRMTILAGDVDAVYNVRPGKDGPDGVLGTGFLQQLGAILDLSTMQMHVKPR